jgi:HAD superfamily hydrolase (TIGR01509 family)
VDAIIFDCDGVLVDSEAIYVDAELEFIARAGARFERGAYIQTFMGLAPDDWRRLLSAEMRARTGRAPAAGFFTALDAFVMEAFEAGLVALPGARQAVANVRALRCVASSTPLERLTWKLQRTGLLDLFTPHLFSADMVSRGKPAPDLFVHAAATLGVDPRNCVVVEDSVNGIRAARAAGMEAIGFTAGTHCLDGHAVDLKANGANVVIDTFADLGAAIDMLTIGCVDG